MSYKVSHHHS